jgi:uncharacterized protein YhjY with autotransporter beta-barrel domain
MLAKFKAAFAALTLASALPLGAVWAGAAPDPEYVASMNAVGPATLELASQAALGVSATNTLNILDQLNERRRGAPGSETIERAWFSGVYNSDDWDDFAGTGLDAKRDGLRGTLAGEYMFLPQLVVGLAVGYGVQNADMSNGLSLAASGWSGTVYGRFASNGFFLNAGYSYGEVDVADIRRPGAFGTTAAGDTRGQTHSYFVQASYMRAAGPVTFGPVIGYSGDYARIKGYTETGGGDGNITYPTNKLYSSLVSFGAEVTGTYWPLLPHARISYNWQIEEKLRNTTLQLATATAPLGSSAVTIPPVNEDFVEFSTGIQGTFDVVQWNVRYGAQLGMHDRFSHLLRAGLTIPFS